MGVLSALPHMCHVTLTSVVHCHPKREYTFLILTPFRCEYPMNCDVNLLGLLHAVTKVATDCLRMSKNDIFVVISYRDSVLQNIWDSASIYYVPRLFLPDHIW